MLLSIGLQWWAGSHGTLWADEWLRDRYINVRASTIPETRLLVVDIGESTLSRYPWPWPRERLATLVETLLAEGARGVALDILQEKPGDNTGDIRLSMLATHAPLVLAQLFDFSEQPSPLRMGQLIGGTVAEEPGQAVIARGFIGSHAGLRTAAYAGNIGVVLDPDGALRHIPMYTWFEGRSYPTLSQALIDCCAGTKAVTPPQEGYMRIPYLRTWDSYRGIEAADVLERKLPPAEVTGRLVLVGSSALSLGDRIATPLGSSTAGLLVHAAVLSTLLDQRSGLAPAPWPGELLALLFSLSVVLLSSYTLPRMSATANMILLLGSSFVWLLLAYPLSLHDPDFSSTSPLACNLFLMLVAVPFQWQLSQRNSRQLLGTLRQYVASAVVDELLRSNLDDPLAPKKVEVTTLVADMQGYTAQVASLSVEDAAKLTTDFLDCLTRPVLDQHGTLDKYTGDGLVAFWGAPLPNAAHADLALDAALSILHEVRQMSIRREKSGLPPIRVRIGIESGVAMAGDYGSSFRSIYTAVGSSVNTASRLEQAARDYDHDVLIGEGTVRQAQRHHFLSLGELTLRGIEKSIQLYTLRMPGK